MSEPEAPFLLKWKLGRYRGADPILYIPGRGAYIMRPDGSSTEMWSPKERVQDWADTPGVCAPCREGLTREADAGNARAAMALGRL